jgi:hypothetical protein
LEHVPHWKAPMQHLGQARGSGEGWGGFS